MIKFNELRIGNKFIGAGMVQTVFEIIDNTDRGKIKQEGYEKIITVEENRNQYKPIECEGIPLTEELIRKTELEQLSDVLITYCHNGFTIFWGDNWYYRTSHYDTIPLLYLHQLQNLFYVVKQRELKFTA